ncbi:hypothetical protein ACTPOK_05080 [Streptomyces inhibens]|uniref:hypothetical protein n=1 Tax=Streptomyces inhibens TaxID=2293571 RepID=UPI00402A6323
MTAPESPNHYPLSGDAQPVAIAPPLTGDPYLWFVTGDAKIGRFRTGNPYDSRVFTPNYSARKAETLTTLHSTVWTYAHTSDDGRVVSCTASGDYGLNGTGPAVACRALAVGRNSEDRERLVATHAGRKSLVFIDTRKGAVEYSTTYKHALYGVAISSDSPTEYWVSCPEAKELLTFDATHGGFSPHPISLEFEPRDIAVSEAIMRTVWVGTSAKKIVKYNVDDPGTVYIDTPAVPGRLLVLPDGALWFTMPDADQIGYINPGEAEVSGSVATGKGTRPSGLALDKNGQLWAGLEGTGQMFRVSEYQLKAVSGQGQEATVGQDFPHPLTVRAEKLDGTPEPGAAITFTVVGDNARFFPGDRQTDQRTTGEDGTAQSSLLRAKEPGTFAVTAEWTDKQGYARFENLVVRATVDKADSTRYHSGAGQHADPGEDFDRRLRVVVVDKNGAPVPKVRVTFRVMGSNPASFDGNPSANATSGADGIATAPVLTAGQQSASFKVEAWAKDAQAGTVFREYID